MSLFWLIITALIYALFFNWLDIPLMYFISHDYQSPLLIMFSKCLKILFLPELWFALAIIGFIYTVWERKQAHFQLRNYILPFSINLIFAFILTSIIKFCCARYRPCDLLNNNLYGFHYFSLDYSSTPSGHTVTAFTLFFTLAHFFRKKWITLLCLIPPIIVAGSRLILADHYISDLIFGAYVGIISVFWGEWIAQRFFAAWLKIPTNAQ